MTQDAILSIVPERMVAPARVLTGPGAADGLLAECARFGRRGVLVHGRSLAAGGALARLRRGGPPDAVVAAWAHAGGEPTLADLERLRTAVREHRADWVAGVGGGSVLDLAKAAAGLCRAGLPAAAYHDGAPVEAPGVPFLAVPTTAGTGSEATVNAVFTRPETSRKKSIRDDVFMARTVILDPILLAACPRPVIANAGMDALTQAIEGYTSRHAVWWSDVLALKAIGLLAGNLEAFYRGADPEAAGRVLLGSYLGGLAFAIARLGVVHGLAHPLGVRYHAPHGLVCGVCLPHAIALNREAVGAKYDAMARALGGDPQRRVEALLERLEVRSPFRGQPVRDRAAIVAETVDAWSTRANPRPITAADVDGLLDRLFAGQ